MIFDVISAFRELSASQKKAWLASLSKDEQRVILSSWRLNGRPEQIAPKGDWEVWAYIAGRGAGKTRSGAEWVREQAQKGVRQIAMIAPTNSDSRKVMTLGVSGLLSVCREHDKTLDGQTLGIPEYHPSLKLVRWQNGAEAHLFSAEEPERLRGPQFEAGWCDELAAWRRLDETWDMFEFGLRLGDNPRCMITTTPKPLKLLKNIMSDPATVISRGSTFDNEENLAGKFLKRIRDRYEGTQLGRQELYAEMLDAVEGALWKSEWIERSRVKIGDEPDLQKLVVAVDPHGGSDLAGIVAAGFGIDKRFYVLEDRTQSGSPETWGKAAVELHDEFNADRIVAEKNFGGDMVKSVIETAALALHADGKRSTPLIKVEMVHASRGKVIRAEPVSQLYEQNRVSHCGNLAALEAEMTLFTRNWDRNKDGSPNRLDALVWALTDLSGNKEKKIEVSLV